VGVPLKALPVATFAASILFDVLAFVADNREQAHAYQRSAADLLRVGAGSALASVALDVIDALRSPAGDDATTRKFAVNGALIGVYLLDLAARQDRAGDVSAQARRVEGLPVGLSLLGLALLGISTNFE